MGISNEHRLQLEHNYSLLQQQLDEERKMLQEEDDEVSHIKQLLRLLKIRHTMYQIQWQLEKL